MLKIPTDLSEEVLEKLLNMALKPLTEEEQDLVADAITDWNNSGDREAFTKSDRKQAVDKYQESINWLHGLRVYRHGSLVRPHKL